MADVRFEQATRIYPGTDVPAVDRLDLHIEDGEFMVLVGPSGSGKSTALRMLAGLEDVDEGGIWVGGRDVTYARPKNRDVAMVFQNYALYPYLTVAANIGFPLKLRRSSATSATGACARSRRCSARAISRAQARAALGRPAPAGRDGRARSSAQPSVYLMDEPLSNLDAKLRVQMRADVAGLQARLGVTTVYVTHDQAEAMTLGHRVAVLKDGRLQQCAPPRSSTTGPRTRSSPASSARPR
jgi:multiple sugar transport system ATP-binding protein